MKKRLTEIEINSNQTTKWTIHTKSKPKPKEIEEEEDKGGIDWTRNPIRVYWIGLNLWLLDSDDRRRREGRGSGH
jgi:hypothetical protein